MRSVTNGLAVVAVLLGCAALSAQTPPPSKEPPPQPPTTTPPTNPDPPPSPPGSDDEGLTVSGTSVGYIDTAAPGNQVFLRTDFGYHFPFPNRAEMFYAQSRPGGPGLPLPERSVDFQDLTFHVERAFGGRVSVFFETGARFLNPEVNRNSAGLSDTNVGFKYAFLTGENGVASFQLRTYIPTGNPNQGLGTSHVSLEPGLLGFARLTDRLGLAGELRYWIPVSGTDFAGSVLRYGLGLRYTVLDTGRVRLTPTTEFIGWTVLGGRQSRLEPNGEVLPQSAAGVSILNAKVGARLDVGDRLGFYMGYGRAITGETWYRDVLRLEARWLY
jgi:hypothetical protein